MKTTDVLSLMVEHEGLTIKEYLCKLLRTLWRHQEGFSGKRPFGNSGWEYDLYIPLVKAKVINGEIDEDGYLDSVDEKAGHRVIDNCITVIFNGV